MPLEAGAELPSPAASAQGSATGKALAPPCTKGSTTSACSMRGSSAALRTLCEFRWCSATTLINAVSTASFATRFSALRAFSVFGVARCFGFPCGSVKVRRAQRASTPPRAPISSFARRLSKARFRRAHSAARVTSCASSAAFSTISTIGASPPRQLSKHARLAAKEDANHRSEAEMVLLPRQILLRGDVPGEFCDLLVARRTQLDQRLDAVELENAALVLVVRAEVHQHHKRVLVEYGRTGRLKQFDQPGHDLTILHRSDVSVDFLGEGETHQRPERRLLHLRRLRLPELVANLLGRVLSSVKPRAVLRVIVDDVGDDRHGG
eukprot:scaffold8272_cov248-Pinguiococcus_pyrenoidosus.AAC.2